ncbi:MAG: DUF1203 domain-containing protein [Burkholderiales bacterium]|nr:DUF1203 domain-containing protein [Burkholderiales bacterium]
MPFRILGLDSTPFRPLFGLTDAALASRGARRYTVDSRPGFPDRVTLTDLAPGRNVLLVNHMHVPENTPYRASHAIFVGEDVHAERAELNAVPPMLTSRLVSLRAFDAAHMMIDADVMDGSLLTESIERMLANPKVGYLHAHFAKRGCFAARIERT